MIKNQSSLTIIPITIIHLFILGKTTIVEPPMDTSVLLGQNSIMKCKVSSDPTVLYQIDWFHNNKYVYNS